MGKHRIKTCMLIVNIHRNLFMLKVDEVSDCNKGYLIIGLKKC